MSSKRIASFLFLLIFSLQCIAQKTKLDSLSNVLKSAKDTAKVNTLIALSNEEFLNRMFDKAALHAHHALELATALDYPKGKAAALFSFGLALSGSGEYEKAADHHNKSIAISESIGEKKILADNFQNIGYIKMRQGEYESAASYYLKSLPLYEQLNDQNRIRITCNSLAATYYYTGNYEKALEFYFKGLKIAETIGKREGMANSLRGIGNVYNDQGNYNEALKYYFEALKIDEEFERKGGIAMSLNNIAGIYNKQKDIENALEFYQRALKIKEEMGDKSGMAITLGNIGNIYAIKNENVKALKTYNQALLLNRELGNKNVLALTYINLGNLYAKTGDYARAKNLLNEGLAISIELDSKEYIKSAYGELAILAEKMSDYKKAYEYQKLYGNIKDTLLNESNTKAIAEMQTKYQTEKVEKENQLLTKDKALQDTELNKQKIVRNSFVVGFILLLGLAFLIYNRYLIKQRANKALEEKNISISRQKEEIEIQKSLVDQKNKEITDSINYAKKIQEAITPSAKFIEELFPKSFVLYKPKDIVSGDFYWFNKQDDKIMFAVADCTGHGVPGALMSMVGNNLLNQIVNERGITQPSQILNQLHKGIRMALKQDSIEAESRDGMDIAFCTLNTINNTLEYSGAFRPLYLIRGDNLQEMKGNRFSIGGIQSEEERVFTNHTIELEKDDLIYIFSDGYADQFGGKNKKKFMTGNFQKSLLAVKNLSMRAQIVSLKKTMEAWKGDLEQVDDILVIGVKV